MVSTIHAATVPKTMQAMALAHFGGLDALEPATLDVPEIAAREALIRVHTAGVGEWDAFEREGGYAQLLGTPGRFPYVLGSEGGGVVVAVGSEVERLAVGDEVYAAAFLNPKGGFYAQYVAVSEALGSRVPSGISLESAAVMAGVGITALRGLEDHLRLARDESLLIVGASGGLGHIAVQLAKRAGARVHSPLAVSTRLCSPHTAPQSTKRSARCGPVVASPIPRVCGLQTRRRA